MQIERIGIIAGTPVDTQMGVKLVEDAGMKAIGVAISDMPGEQALLQILHPRLLTEKVVTVLQAFTQKGIEKVIVNCNSMAAAIDMPFIRSELPSMLVVTPLDIYNELACDFDRVIIWAANGQSFGWH